MEVESLTYDFFDSCVSLSDAARKIFGRDNYRDCEKIKTLALKCGFDWAVWAERRKPKKSIVKCLNCGKEFETIVGWKHHEKKFCSQSCATSYNNKKRNSKPLIKHMVCECCGKELFNKQYGTKYCSRECQLRKQYEEYIEKWKKGEENGTKGKYDISGHVRRYLFEKYNCKCEKCGWGEENPISHKIPLQIHHIDGDCLNNKEENLQLLCPNCHSLTETFGRLNKISKRVFRKQKENI